ncbi:MAG: cell division protein ZapA [bacterium]
MAQVNISINNQTYTITCDDGQEERLVELAAYFDDHVQNLAQQIGQVTDSRLMLLAGLTVCDEISELKARLHMMEEQTGLTSEKGAVAALDEACEKVRHVTGRLEQAASAT